MFDYEKVIIMSEISELIRGLNQSLDRLREYREKYPYLMAPNIAGAIEDNIKESVTLLLREMNNLNKPKQEQRRYVCPECNGVFMVALPGGLCDECRSRVATAQPRQYTAAPVAVRGEAEDAAPVAEESAARIEEDAAAPVGVETAGPAAEDAAPVEPATPDSTADEPSALPAEEAPPAVEAAESAPVPEPAPEPAAPAKSPSGAHRAAKSHAPRKTGRHRRAS